MEITTVPEPKKDDCANNSYVNSAKEAGEPRVSIRKLKKKQRRSAKRKQAALRRLAEESAADNELDEQLEEVEREEQIKKSIEENRLWEEREREAQLVFAHKRELERLEQERKDVEEQQRKERLEREKVERKEKAEKLRLAREAQAVIQASRPGVDPTADKNYGTEKDSIYCSFYLKTGSCKFGDRCGKKHPYPTESVTVLIKNMYDGLGLTEVVADDADDDLQYSDADIRQHFGAFYDDVVPEFRKYGRLVMFKVCRNNAAHLRGNVYAQFADTDSGSFASVNHISDFRLILDIPVLDTGRMWEFRFDHLLSNRFQRVIDFRIAFSNFRVLRKGWFYPTMVPVSIASLDSIPISHVSSSRLRLSPSGCVFAFNVLGSP
eukprot:TRINITY_DN8933_c0_g1_i1.p1 TRINITY_DN8933_c0_g1~~TRINITY_DN8933_c0_g1_i1.p1  ORF type:complete len:379 (+),score=86.25 TRINITY_DN8933_c0_g1_i1:113-1249(+)